MKNSKVILVFSLPRYFLQNLTCPSIHSMVAKLRGLGLPVMFICNLVLVLLVICKMALWLSFYYLLISSFGTKNA